MTAANVLSFARDVKPLFTEFDRNAMLFAFDLWRVEDVHLHATLILERLERLERKLDQQDMPFKNLPKDFDFRRFERELEPFREFAPRWREFMPKFKDEQFRFEFKKKGDKDDDDDKPEKSEKKEKKAEKKERKQEDKEDKDEKKKF